MEPFVAEPPFLPRPARDVFPERQQKHQRGSVARGPGPGPIPRAGGGGNVSGQNLRQLMADRPKGMDQRTPNNPPNE